MKPEENYEGKMGKFLKNSPTRKQEFINEKTMKNRSLELSYPNFFKVSADFSEKKMILMENLKVSPAILLETRKGNTEFLHKRKELFSLKYKLAKKSLFI